MGSTNGEDVVGGKCALKIWREVSTPNGATTTTEVDSLDPSDGLHDSDGQYAIVARQIVDDKNRLESTKLRVNSPHILRAFRDVIVTHPTIPVEFTEPFEMESPFQAMFHYWDELFDYRQKLQSEVARKHLDILCDFMNKSMGSEKRKVDAMISKGQIDFDSLWTIFKPQKLTAMHVNGHAWLLKITKTATEETGCDGKFLEVHQTFTSSDGNDIIVRADYITKIKRRSYFPQGSPASINDLPVCPLEFVRGYDVNQDELVARGEHYLQMRARSIHYYDGSADYLKVPPDDFFDPNMDKFADVWLPYTETGRVIVDPKTFEEDQTKTIGPRIHDVTDEDRSLCPPFVYGYSTARKQWCRFYLPHLQEVEWKPNSFDSLIIPEKHLHLVKALVSSHEFPENARDAIEQKGKGMVALLHGPPGSGKTLTAECAAEATHRALLSTSMSELNECDYAPLFERNLKNLLRLATIWKAVVLFDEADVFLESRSTNGENDVSRNALVAVFLRHLEYFSGIVFLTTNRITVFDAAMKSRVHLALGYEMPGKDSLRRIWTNALQKIPESDRHVDLAVVSELLAQEAINGREVTNTVNTAYTLARYEGSSLKQSHLETVLEVRKQFELTLKGK